MGNEKCVMEIENEKFFKNCKGNLFPPNIYQLTTNPPIFKSSQFSNFQILPFSNSLVSNQNFRYFICTSKVLKSTTEIELVGIKIAATKGVKVPEMAKLKPMIL